MAPTNYLRLEAALEEAAFEAVRRLVHAHSSEGLYCVALYTSYEYRYAYVTANSAKGLSDLVEARLAQGTESDRQSARAAYKWSPCDWPYHLAHEHLFQRAYELLEEIWASVDDASDEEADHAYIAIHEVFVSVLSKVRNSGVVPDDCLVMLLAGDQSDEARIVNAEEINDLSLVARFLPDFDPDAGRLAMLRANRWPPEENFDP